MKIEEARTHCNEGEQQTCSWVVCLNKQNRWQRDMYPSTATHCLRKYFAVVLEIKRLEPVEIDGFGPGKTFEPLKDHPKLLRLPISCIFRKRIWSRSKVCGWRSKGGRSHLSKVERIDKAIEFELFWVKFPRTDSFPILRQTQESAESGMWQRSFRNDYETETFQRQLRKLDNLVTRAATGLGHGLKRKALSMLVSTRIGKVASNFFTISTIHFRQSRNRISKKLVKSSGREGYITYYACACRWIEQTACITCASEMENQACIGYQRRT